MKKIIISAVLCMVMAAGPAMAIDADFSGEYWVEGIYNENYSLSETSASTSDAYLQMRLRLKTVFKVSDNLSLTTRLDGLEKRWGDSDGAKATTTTVQNYTANDDKYTSTTTIEDDDNIDLDWAYMTVKTSIGGFLVGRQNGNAWGLPFSDSAGPRDRITYVLPINNLIIAAVYEKNKELDGQDLTQNDADLDKYYLSGTYKGENFTTGLLYGYYDYKTFQDMAQATDTAAAKALADDAGYDLGGYLASVAAGAPLDGTGALYGQIIAAGVDTGNLSTCQGTAHLLSPYFKGKFGDFGLIGELTYATGEAEYDSTNNAGKNTKDVEVMAFNIEGTYDMGAFSFQGGYAYVSGDADYTDDKVEAYGYLELGEDWEKLAILTGTSYGVESVLGGLGNLSNAGIATYDGFQMFYAGADYAVNKDMTIGLLVGQSKADEVRAGWEDDHGIEYDVTLEWKIFENLTYKAIGAFLSAGDYWKQGDATAQLDDTYLLYHRLTLEF